MSKNIVLSLLQIFYDEQSKANLDPLCIPIFNPPKENELWFEYGVMRELWMKYQHFFADYTGVLSHRFNEKSRLTAVDVQQFVQNNPGYDVYLFNPYMLASAFFVNVWRQGETCHPGLIKVTEGLFKQLGQPVNLDYIDSPDNITYCNYWVGNRQFWQAYLEFCEPIFQLIEQDIENKLGAKNKDSTYYKNYPFVPFIMERMVSLFIQLNPQFKVKAFHYPESAFRHYFSSTPIYELYQLKRQLDKPQNREKYLEYRAVVHKYIQTLTPEEIYQYQRF